MRWAILLAAALAALALVASVKGVGPLRSWTGSRNGEIIARDRIQTYIRRDERGRPVCRRGVPGDDQDRVVEIGHNCP